MCLASSHVFLKLSESFLLKTEAHLPGLTGLLSLVLANEKLTGLIISHPLSFE